MHGSVKRSVGSVLMIIYHGLYTSREIDSRLSCTASCASYIYSYTIDNTWTLILYTCMYTMDGCTWRSVWRYQHRQFVLRLRCLLDKLHDQLRYLYCTCHPRIYTSTVLHRFGVDTYTLYMWYVCAFIGIKTDQFIIKSSSIIFAVRLTARARAVKYIPHIDISPTVLVR